jgi:hypothetical protein
MLKEYNKKRNFVRTPEPRGTTKQSRVDNKSYSENASSYIRNGSEAGKTGDIVDTGGDFGGFDGGGFGNFT